MIACVVDVDAEECIEYSNQGFYSEFRFLFNLAVLCCQVCFFDFLLIGMGEINMREYILRKQVFSLSLLILVTVLSFWVSSVSAEQHLSGKAEYLIGIGDVIEIQVWHEPDLSRTLTVRLDGRISLPLVGDVDVAGKSTREVDQYLENKFSELVTEPAVAVIIIESRSQRYYVVGQVSQPGEFPIDSPLTLLQVIARSGGFQEWAKRDQIKVFRREAGEEKMLDFDYDDFVKGRNLKQNIFVAPGDTVIVP